MYEKLTDKKFFRLIFTEGYRLGLDYIEEARSRRSALLPMLCAVLTKESSYRHDDEKFWGVIQAVHIVGILGDPAAFDALALASKYSHQYDNEWIWDAVPECYLRMGQGIVPRLMRHIDFLKSWDHDLVEDQIMGLWNLWERYPEERSAIENSMLNVLTHPETDLVTRAALICDFAQIGRHDLKPLFEDFYERGDVDMNALPRDDMDFFFGRTPETPGFRYDLEGFYSQKEIDARQARWEKERKGHDRTGKKSIEDFILENFSKISRNDLCPCGSEKKFKKCHLPWAEEELHRAREREDFEDERVETFRAIQRERASEAALRRMLTRKGQTGLFSELRSRVVEAIKTPMEEFSSRGFFSYFEPLFAKLEFKNREETEEFIAALMNYFNALSHQILGRGKPLN